MSNNDRIRSRLYFFTAFWQVLFRLRGVALTMSTTYHPHTDGQSESMNRCLEGYLWCMTFERPSMWNKWLSLWHPWGYNTTFYSSIRMTPFQALYGFLPPLHIPYVLGDTSVTVVDDTLTDREHTLCMLHHHLLRAQNCMKQFVFSR